MRIILEATKDEDGITICLIDPDEDRASLKCNLGIISLSGDQLKQIVDLKERDDEVEFNDIMFNEF